MSEVEALLSVDAGRVPPDTVVFRARDPEAPVRKTRAALAVSTALFGLLLAVLGAGREPVALLFIVTAMLALAATPTAPEPEQARHKRPTLVLTPTGMIVRDASGLRSWQYDELLDVRTCVCQGQVGMVVVVRNGSMHFIDNLMFTRGEALGGMIRSHLQPHRT